MNNALILLTIILVAAILAAPRLAKAPLWRATITPLASIIGSGFLVLGPILDSSYGIAAPLVMLGLCTGAYLFGTAIRFNIGRFERTSYKRSPLEEHIEKFSAWALAFAYIISVAYYLNLLGAFAVALTETDNPLYAKLVTTGVFTLILIVGWTRGFSALERLEQISVGIKLSVIAGLLVGMAWFFAQQAGTGALVIKQATVTGWPAIALALGLLVTVQGFETSRYLGDDYDAATRIRSMRLAQILSSAIYMIYIGLMVFLFAPSSVTLSETAIIGLMAIVAPILPVLLIVAAISAQFSAAVADTSGSGGLIAELTGKRLSQRSAYAVLVIVGVVLTWTTGIYEIISHASRAFALYYGLQALIAAKGAHISGAPSGRVILFLGLAGLGFAAALFGVPVE